MKSIRISEENYMRLSKLRLESETCSDILERLIEFYEKNCLDDFSDE